MTIMMAFRGGGKSFIIFCIVRQVWSQAVPLLCAVRMRYLRRSFLSLSNFFMSTCTLEGRHWMAKAKCHSSITDLRGNFSPANSRCRDFMPAIFITSVQNCRCPSGWLSSRKWNLVSQEVLRLGAA